MCLDRGKTLHSAVVCHCIALFSPVVIAFNLNFHYIFLSGIYFIMIIFIHFRYLIENGANVAAVNNDGDLPIDIAESTEMEEYLSDVLDEQGIFHLYYSF